MNRNVVNSKLPAGPVITISRECGCSAKRIATKLSKVLSGYSYRPDTKTEVEWRWISKEIIEDAANELEISPEKVKSVFMAEKKIPISEVSTAFSTEKVYDMEDQHVIETVGATIRNFAEVGNFIIVGRGASIFTKDIENRLSIRLKAPLDWRVNRIMQISEMSYAEARDYVIEIDRQRSLFVEHVAGRKIESTDFDVMFNYSTMNDDHIVNAIVDILKSRHVF
jgi:cytidylate kinase